VILVLRALGVGDLATGVPALRGLRAAFPGERLVLAAPQWLRPLIELVGGVDEVLPTTGLEPRGWPMVFPALAVNLHGRGPQSHRLLQSAAPATLWAFTSEEAGHRGPAWTAEEHEVHRWCRLLRFYGVRADEDDLSLDVPPVPVPEGVTIIHPGAKSPSRCWPADRWVTVARWLCENGHRVMITGSAGEHELTTRIAREAGAVAPVTELRELAGLVAHARLVVSGDTGIAHLATAYARPSVTLFGPMSPERWGPPDRPWHRPLWHGTRSEPGDSTAPGVHPALLRIRPDEVNAAATRVCEPF
jgi:ADP-heptose:LPS heptosyltransferase